jgi:hypothetical protein
VTPHEGIAFFKRGTRVGGRKDKEEQLCSDILLGDQVFLDTSQVNMSAMN